MVTDRHLPDWDENALGLGIPQCMDTPTLIEWIERQLETPEETAARREQMRIRHQIWHDNTMGTYTCCINTNLTGIFTVNEKRRADQLQQEALEAFKRRSSDNIMYLSEGVKYIPLNQESQ